jgi:hypothetical protein
LNVVFTEMSVFWNMPKIDICILCIFLGF